MPYVIIRRDGKYLTPPETAPTYTRDPSKAWRFVDRAEADEQAAMVDGERVIDAPPLPPGPDEAAHYRCE